MAKSGGFTFEDIRDLDNLVRRRIDLDGLPLFDFPFKYVGGGWFRAVTKDEQGNEQVHMVHGIVVVDEYRKALVEARNNLP